jgi:metallo-beta-lactamase family protein
MATSATEIYRAFLSRGKADDEDLAGALRALGSRHLQLARSVSDSKDINRVSGPAVIIASSGMMTGGRILHHLRQRLPREENTVVLGGFMAQGTRGRALADGAPSLRIHGRDVAVRAAVVQLSALSGHADRRELLRWLAPLPAPRRVFLTHGEPAGAQALADELKRRKGWETVIPRMGEAFTLAE